MWEFNILVLRISLHSDLHEDSNLINDNKEEGTRLCMTFNCYRHMLVYMKDYGHNAQNE